MAVNIEARIVDGLLAHFATLSLPAGTTVAYPNTDFVPDGQPYVRLSIVKGQPITRHIGGGREPERSGFLLALVRWPNGAGLTEPSELAGQIRDHFAFNTKIDHDGITIRVVEEPRVAGDEQGSAYLEIPVVIPWRVYS